MQKAYRLTKNASFGYVYRKGEAVGGKLAVLAYVPAKNIKVGVSVSKKVGKSVVRSLVKRRINESFAKLIPLIGGGYNYVVVAKEPVAEASFAEIGAELKSLLVRAGHIKENV